MVDPFLVEEITKFIRYSAKRSVPLRKWFRHRNKFVTESFSGFSGAIAHYTYNEFIQKKIDGEIKQIEDLASQPWDANERALEFVELISKTEEVELPDNLKNVLLLHKALNKK